MLFITGSSFYLIIKFPIYIRFKAIFVIFFVINSLLFIRFSDKEKDTLQRITSNKFFPRKLSITMEGKYLIFITLGIGLAAINTGLNLLYLLMTMLLSLMAASGILSELNLRKILWELDLPSEATVDSQALAILTMKNFKKKLSSFSLEGILLTDEGSGILQNKGSLIKLNAGENGQIPIKIIFPKRGKQNIKGVSIGTRFPFSFFLKSRHFLFDRSVLVVPKSNMLVQNLIAGVTQNYKEQIQSSENKGSGFEFHSVRPMNPGDDWRSIHWKKTAVNQEFVIRDFESIIGKNITIYLTGNKEMNFDLEAREKGIEIIASLGRFLINQKFRVGLDIPGFKINEAMGAGALKNILVALALFESNQIIYSNRINSKASFAQPSIVVDLDTLKVSQKLNEVAIL